MGDVIYGRLQSLNAKNAIHCNFSGATRFHIFYFSRQTQLHTYIRRSQSIVSYVGVKE